MGPDEPSLPGEPQGAPHLGASDEGLAMREPYLRRVLADFEAGRIEAYDYTRRVLAINAAASTAQMETIAGQLPQNATNDAESVRSVSFDAVDLARFKSARLSESRSPTTRYVALAIVFVVFAVLIGIGMWLVSHVHAAALGPSAAFHSGLALGWARWS